MKQTELSSVADLDKEELILLEVPNGESVQAMQEARENNLEPVTLEEIRGNCIQ